MWKARYTVSISRSNFIDPNRDNQLYSRELQTVEMMCVCVCARPQPFSNGLVTVMVPQLRRENSLLLWSTLDLNSPVHAFVGHDDVVLEFQWRPQKEGDQSQAEIQEMFTHILKSLQLFSAAFHPQISDKTKCSV